MKHYLTIRELKKEIEGVFKQPIKRYYFGKIAHGTPYFNPWHFCPTIFYKKRQFDRCKSFKIFGHEIAYGWPISWVNYKLGWKDKWGSPRFEWNPSFQIWFFNWQWCIWWTPPEEDSDRYWEMVLHYLYYADKDIKKAEETWGWVDFTTKKSTWNKNNLL